MAAKHLVVALLAALAASAVVEARLFQADDAKARSLLQAPVNARCPAGCAAGACVLDSTSGGYKCTACKNKLVVNQDDGTCGCPAGRRGTNEDCSDCPKGSYCLGGTYTAQNVPAATTCPNSLSTIGMRSTSLKACVNTPGSFYIQGDTPSQETCPANSYGPGWRKQRACVPCPPGFITTGTGLKVRASDCVVPKGYYLKGPGQVAPCPKGEYKDTEGAAASCSKCPAGVTTEQEASIARTACNSVLPTFYPANITANVVEATKKCPQKFYCPGGKPTAAFNPLDTSALTGTTVSACPSQTWTEDIGASSADQCMTPPGYKTVGANTSPCDPGSYRAEWKPAAQAGSCDECGADISSEATEEITEINISDYDVKTKVYVRGSASACYIKPGQGMYFSPATNKYTAVNCEADNYGVANTTYGLAAYPCRDCPSGMQAKASLTESAKYKSDNGFTSPMACVTRAGFGYNGRVANKCPVGSYNGEGNYGTCTQCSAGYTTAAEGSDASDDCKIAPGYGSYNGTIIPCPVGSYNPDVMPTAAECTLCGTGLTTSQAGGRSTEDCNVCKLGHGGNGTCAPTCGGANGASYGPAGRSISSPGCEACPTMSVGFSFDHAGVNQPFTPAPVARASAESAADCLAEFAQIEDAAWYMGGSAALTNITDSANTFDDCVAACKGDDNCQYITFDYDAQQCFKRVAVTGASGEVLAFKAVVAGDTTAASKDAKANALASGSYTFWNDAGAGVGTTTDATAATVAACLSVCDKDAACAGVVMTGATSLTAAPGSCKLIKGDSSVATFKRSVTKTVVTKLTLA